MKRYKEESGKEIAEREDALTNTAIKTIFVFAFIGIIAVICLVVFVVVLIVFGPAQVFHRLSVITDYFWR